MKILTIEQQAKPRTRRLRKKLRVGEFQEFGFTLSFTFNPHQMSFDYALDAWIEFIESQGWICGGGGEEVDNEIEVYVLRSGRGTMTEQDRELVRQWLSAQSWVTAYQAEPLSDAWYGPWEE